MPTLKTALRGLGYLLLYAGLILWAVFSILPILWSLSASFKHLNEIFRYPPTFIPQSLNLANYINLFSRGYARWYINSLGLGAVSTILVVFFCSVCGFAFAKYSFRLKSVLFTAVIGSMMIPFQLILTPLYAEMNALRWLNTYWALIIPWMVPAFGVFLMRQYMVTIPSELLDAARIDGCSEFRIFGQVVLPLARPALGTLAIYQFMSSWNSYLWPYVVLSDMRLYTIPLGLAALKGQLAAQTIDYGTIMAGSFLATLPAVIVFLFMQRQFIAGLTLGSVRG